MGLGGGGRRTAARRGGSRCRSNRLLTNTKHNTSTQQHDYTNTQKRTHTKHTHNANNNTKQDRFVKLGIRPPKGVLLYGPPGTGKTLIARACAAQTNATFLKLAGPQLVQMFIGDGAKMVRDAFALAKEKQPAIIFIDEVRLAGWW